MKIENHLLVDNNITKISCPKNKISFNNLDTIIIHFTAGSSAISSAHYLATDDLKASAHLVIGQVGDIYQLVSFDTIAWHAGTSYYNGRSGFNKYSIGIEIDNAGELIKIGDTYQSYFGKIYTEDEVISAYHRNDPTKKVRYWQKYTDKQIQLVEQICELLIKEYDITKILGHEEIAPDRKIDPGPAFPLDELRFKMFNKQLTNLTTDLGEVTALALHIRSAPNIVAEQIFRPLKRGTKVKILEEFGAWYKVELPIIGWVSKKYISTK